MVFQNYALYPHMTVRRNIAFGLELRRVAREEIDRRVGEAANILGLTDDMLERKPKALSGGQRQRVALGRAIVRKPKVFLFDEPLSNLDAKMRVQMRAEISKLHRQLKSTMVYVTHDQVEAMTMGDRICVLKDGRVQQVDRPLEIYNRPANLFVAGFIGSPPMNFLAGTVMENGGGLYFKRSKVPAETSPELLPILGEQAKALAASIGKPVIMGIRSEDLELKTKADQVGDGNFLPSDGGDCRTDGRGDPSLSQQRRGTTDRPHPRSGRGRAARNARSEGQCRECQVF